MNEIFNKAYVSLSQMQALYSKILQQNTAPTLQKFCQYTTVAGLDGMLKSGSLWATNIKFLNDSSEYELGRQYILRSINERIENEEGNATLLYIQKTIEQTFENTANHTEELTAFTVSFCGNNDLLSQWIAYAKESGICIEFDFNSADYSALYKVDDKVYEPYYFERMFPSPVIYLADENNCCETSREQQKAYDNLFQNLYDHLSSDYNNDCPRVRLTNYAIIRAIACFIKNVGFRAEDESRLLVFPISNCTSSACKSTPIHFRLSDRNVFRPYVEIYCGRKICDDDVVPHFTGLPVKSITVGPGGNQDAVFQSIIFRIENGMDYETKLAKIEGDTVQKEYYTQFWDEMKNNGETSNIEKKQLLQLEEEFKSDFTGFVTDIKNQPIFIKYQRECYFSERRNIIIRKSKIPYIY